MVDGVDRVRSQENAHPNGNEVYTPSLRLGWEPTPCYQGGSSRPQCD